MAENKDRSRAIEHMESTLIALLSEADTARGNDDNERGYRDARRRRILEYARQYARAVNNLARSR